VPLVQNLRFHDYQFEYSVSAGKWLWTTRVDVSQSVPAYQVRDIRSPYGLLRDSIPIPGEIVQAMSESIVELRSNFSPNILIGPPSSIVFEVDEGRGYSPPQVVLVTNSGVYGSILGASLTSSAPFVRVNPSTIGGLSVNESGNFVIEVDSTGLLASSSPYSETVVVQDPMATNNPQSVPVLINVRPKAQISSDTVLLTFSVVHPFNGPFPPPNGPFPPPNGPYLPVPTQDFTLENSGPLGSVLEYDIRALTGLCGGWLRSWLPAEGTLQSGEEEVITVTVQPPGWMLPGIYSEKLRIIGYSSNSYVDVEIRLVIT
jgi:hypothetical protein